MHRHGYKGKKLHRETDQRQALIKGLSESLIIHGKIETTLAKAKEMQPYVEKLVTTAKVNDLHHRRQVINKLHTLDAAHKLVDDIAPQLSGRHSGYTSISRTVNRKGDNAQLATIKFVDDINQSTEVAKITPQATAKKSPKVSESK